MVGGGGQGSIGGGSGEVPLPRKFDHPRLPPFLENPLHLFMPIQKAFHVLGDVPGGFEFHGEALYRSGSSVHPQKAQADGLEGSHRTP